MSANVAFTPTRPRSSRDALAGRRRELNRVIEALNDETAHVVIYAERGRGKTSLANTIVQQLRQSGAIVGRFVCSAESDFDAIIHGVMRDLPSSLLTFNLDDDAQADGKTNARGCESILPPGTLQPADVADISRHLMGSRLIFVIDEFDRVLDPATRTRLADTIKLLSDRGLKLLFMIVGVSSTLEQIIGQHPSIQRNITGVHLALMQDDEVEAMLVSGGEAVGITFTAGTCAAVAGVARGMPYMAQLMGLRILQQTVSRGATETSPDDFTAAVERLIADQPPEIVARYLILTETPQADPATASINIASDKSAALNIVAASAQDEFGNMKLADLDAAGRKALLDAHVIEPSPSRPGTFQVADRPLMYYVQLLAARERSAQAAPSGYQLSVSGHQAGSRTQ